jgi:uncharacterized protein YbjT (DUF2867 family)
MLSASRQTSLKKLASNFLDPILAGEVALPVGPVPEPFVDAEDIADVAVAAQAQPGHSRQLYELTGPRALTFVDAIGEIARATGLDIRYPSIAPQEYCAALVQAQVPEVMIELVLYLFSTVLDGRNTAVADGVQRALGRAPRDFTQYVKSAMPGVDEVYFWQHSCNWRGTERNQKREMTRVDSDLSANPNF